MSGEATRQVLVTGGAGFIGSHLCDRLVAEGHQILCVDNLVTGREANVQHLFGHTLFTFLHHDITNPLQADVDQLFNLACPASPVQYRRNPLATLRASVIGSTNVLELARDLGAPVFHASTSEIYGDPTVHPQPESYAGHLSTLSARACYSEGKRCAETIFADYHRQYGIAVTMARIFNTYGPRMAAEDGRVVSTFIVQALQNQPITIFGSGGQTRSFCYVDDLIEGILRCSSSESSRFEPVNLGNPHETTVRSLAETILEMTNSRSSIVEQPAVEDEPRRRCPDISRARATLGWEPRISLRKGLEMTIEWFDTLLSRGGVPNL